MVSAAKAQKVDGMIYWNGVIQIVMNSRRGTGILLILICVVIT